MHKAYIGAPGAQIHYREAGQGTSLILLPPSPHSGLYYTAVMPFLASAAHVIAPDYPGFGGSDLLPGVPTIEGYAQSLVPLFESVGGANIAGFHSGNLVALELSLTRPELVKGLLMIDVPYFEREARQNLDAKMGQPAVLPSAITDLEAGFKANVTNRLDDLGHARAYNIWAETLRAGEGKNAAFHAAFTYDCETRFAALPRPAALLATQSGLLEPTRKAAKAMQKAVLTERLDIEGAVFDKYAETIAAFISQTFRS